MSEPTPPRTSSAQPELGTGDTLLAASPATGSDGELVAAFVADPAGGLDLAQVRANVARRLFGETPSDAQAAEASRTIGRFVLGAPIGRGGMGVVYRARDPKLDRDVAVKLVLGPGSEDTLTRARMLREARAMAKIMHPNVVVVHEVGEHAGNVFIAMELVEGMSLRQWLAETPRSFAEILDIFIGAGRGLMAAHEAGIIHRDFKPDNVLVGRDGRPRVLDFGLAHTGDTRLGDLSDAESGATDPTVAITLAGTFAGTPAYMAPEQFDGQPSDARTDQFAFAVSLFEALDGERPYASDNLRRLAAALRSDRPRELAGDSRVPITVRDALRRSLARTPAERFPDLSQLLDVLVVARHPRRRSRGLWIAAGVLGLSSLWMLREPQLSAQQVESPAIQPSVDPRAAWAPIVAASSLPPTRSTPDPDDPTRTTVHRLDNGLTVYVATRREIPRVQARLVVRAGSVDDPRGLAGAATILARVTARGSERMGTTDWEGERALVNAMQPLFGTPERAPDPSAVRELVRLAKEVSRFEVAGEYEEIRRALGISGTTEVDGEATTITADLPSSRIGAWLELEAERIRRPVFRGVVAEIQRAMESEARRLDPSPSLAPRVARAWFGPDDPDAHEAGGTPDTLARISPASLAALHAARYRPNNTALVLVGDVDATDVLPMIERHFGDWEPAPTPRAGCGYVDASATRTVVDGDADSPWVFAWPVVRNGSAATRAFEATVDALTDEWIAREGVPDGFPWEGRCARGIAFNDAAAAARARVALNHALAATSAATMNPPRRSDFLAEVEGDEGLADALADRYVTGDDLPFRKLEGLDPGMVAAARDLVARTPLTLEPSGGQSMKSEPSWPRIDAPAREGSSVFARDILTRSFPAGEPQFIVRGRHYDAVDRPGGRIIASRCDRGVEHLSIRVDTEDVPRADGCRVVVATSFAMVRSHAPDVGDGFANFTCTVGNVRQYGELLVRGAAFADVSWWLQPPARWLEKPGTGAVLQASAEQASSALGTVGPFLAQSATHSRALQLLGDPDAPDFASAFGRRDGFDVDALLAGWSAVAGHPVDVLYCGSDPQAVLAWDGLDEPSAPRSPSRRPAKVTERSGRHVYLLDAPGVPTVATVYLGPAAAWAAIPTLVAEAMTNALRRSSHTATPSESDFRIDATVDDPLSITIEATSDPDAVLAALTSLVALLDAGQMDPAALEEARAAVEHRIRTTRLAPADVPAEVLRWFDRGRTGDPRIDLWASLGGVTTSEIATWLTTAREQALTIVISGSLAELDLDRLADIGELHRLD